MPSPNESNTCPQCGGGPVTWKCLCKPMWRPSAVALDDERAATIALLKRALYVRHEDLPNEVRVETETRAAYGNSSAWQDARDTEQRRLINEAIALLEARAASTSAPTSEPHGVVICDKRIPNALETFIPQRFYKNHHWGDEYSKVEVFVKPPPKLSESEFDALDTALNQLKHNNGLNEPAQRAVPVIRAMILAHDPTYKEVKF